jgi:hypothetical protein
MPRCAATVHKIMDSLFGEQLGTLSSKAGRCSKMGLYLSGLDSQGMDDPSPGLSSRRDWDLTRFTVLQRSVIRPRMTFSLTLRQ